MLSSAVWGSCTGSSPTWTSTPDYASVSTCVTNAVNGDTINISSGTATWTSTLSWNTKGISLIGAGQGVTVITNNVGTSTGATLIQVSSTGNNFIRISGFTINGTDDQEPVIEMIGPIYKIRVDHVTFNGGGTVASNYITNKGAGPVYGVFDHSIFLNMKRPYYATDIRTSDSTWGTAAWNEFLANPASFPGSGNMLYFEDDQFTWNRAVNGLQGALYGGYGGKAVFRHNTLSGDCTYVDAHGDGPDYGTIYYEIYNNVFNEDDTLCGQGDIVGMRGGQLIAHDNQFTGSAIPFQLVTYWALGVELATHRVQNTYIWNNTWNGGSSQVSVYDHSGTCTTPCINLNQQYFLAAPQSGQTYYPYRPYAYPHPLTNVTKANAPVPPTGLSASVQ
jgi:hypothetical protein